METIANLGNQYVWGWPEQLPWLVVLLLSAGLFITTRLLFIQVRQVGHAIRVVMGKYDDPNDPGDVNHFQALSTALSATVGIGNIAGVAMAIHYGGPGAVFWMWVTAFFGMALKFSECTLSLHYRKFDDKGDAAGGPMYYIERGLGRSWKPLAVFFAVCAIISSFGGGNMNQANTVALSARTELGIAPYLVGGVLVLIVGAVILGGIRSIARVASALAPSMALVYVLGALTILLLHAGDVPGAFGEIFSNAFDPEAGLGGGVAGAFMTTLLWGVKRGLFSNEAGQGSAPIAHAAAKTDEPVREGAVAMLGPLIDTLIICTMTALVIVITGVWDQKKDTRQLLDRVTPVAAEVPTTSVGTLPAKLPKPEVALEVDVRDGQQADLAFVAFDGLVDAPRIVDTDGNPWSGTLKYDPKTGLKAFDLDGGDATVRVAGGMLQDSSALTAWAFETGLARLGGWGSWVVTICVFLFAISTMISWSYYGDRCVTYLFGSKYVIVYRMVYIGFAYVGATTALDVVWAYGDLALGLMTVPNLIAVMLLSPKVVELSRDYFTRMKKQDLHG